MTSLKPYRPYYTDPNGNLAALGEIYATSDQDALHKLGKLIRRKADELHRDGRVSLTDEKGDPVSGSLSTVAEHMARPTA